MEGAEGPQAPSSVRGREHEQSGVGASSPGVGNAEEPGALSTTGTAEKRPAVALGDDRGTVTPVENGHRAGAPETEGGKMSGVSDSNKPAADAGGALTHEVGNGRSDEGVFTAGAFGGAVSAVAGDAASEAKGKVSRGYRPLGVEGPLCPTGHFFSKPQTPLASPSPSPPSSSSSVPSTGPTAKRPRAEASAEGREKTEGQSSASSPSVPSVGGAPSLPTAPPLPKESDAGNVTEASRGDSPTREGGGSGERGADRNGLARARVDGFAPCGEINGVNGHKEGDHETPEACAVSGRSPSPGTTSNGLSCIANGYKGDGASEEAVAAASGECPTRVPPSSSNGLVASQGVTSPEADAPEGAAVSREAESSIAGTKRVRAGSDGGVGEELARSPTAAEKASLDDLSRRSESIPLRLDERER